MRFRIFAAGLFLVPAFTGISQASTVQLDLTAPPFGPIAQLGLSGSDNIGAVATFTVNQTINNAVITPDFFCIDCDLTFNLHAELPDLTTNSKSYIASLRLTTPVITLNSAIDPMINVGTLLAGTSYSLVATAERNSNFWLGGTDADLVTTGTGAVTAGESYIVKEFDQPFTTTLAQTLTLVDDANWLFSITGDLASSPPTTVPLPAGYLLLGTALMGLRATKRRT